LADKYFKPYFFGFMKKNDEPVKRLKLCHF
jgi:hypothetical protein